MKIELRIEAGDSLVKLADKLIAAFGISSKQISDQTEKLKESSDALKKSVDQAVK